jgi:23S rRNA pseudouridine1911/1915/1917 synthase
MIQEFEITAEHLDQFKRLDAFLANKIPDFSRTLLKKFYEQGKITSSSDEKLILKKMPSLGTVIYFEVPEVEDVDIKPQNIPLEILFEDDHLLVINKQAGLVIHPAPGNWDGTLVNAVLFHCPNLSGIGNEKRPGIVHRLDKGTTGVMVVAKSQKCHEGLVELFSKHDIDRYYEAIIIGKRAEPEKTLKSTIGRSPNNRLKMAINVNNGKEAITHMKVLKYYNHFSHVELKLETGRTHQIRVHLNQMLNSPILNDHLYGRLKEEKIHHTKSMKNLLKEYEYPFLHAKTLGFVHPITKEKLLFKTPPPKIFQDILNALETEDV